MHTVYTVQQVARNFGHNPRTQAVKAIGDIPRIDSEDYEKVLAKTGSASSHYTAKKPPRA